MIWRTLSQSMVPSAVAGWQGTYLAHADPFFSKSNYVQKCADMLLLYPLRDFFIRKKKIK